METVNKDWCECCATLNVFYVSFCFSLSPAAMFHGTLDSQWHWNKMLNYRKHFPIILALQRSYTWATLEGSSDTHKDDLLKKLWPRLALLVCQDVKFQKYSDSCQLQERSRVWSIQSTYVQWALRQNNMITRDHHGGGLKHRVTLRRFVHLGYEAVVLGCCRPYCLQRNCCTNLCTGVGPPASFFCFSPVFISVTVTITLEVLLGNK